MYFLLAVQSGTQYSVGAGDGAEGCGVGIIVGGNE